MSLQQETRYLGAGLWVDGLGNHWVRLRGPDGTPGPVTFFFAEELDWSRYPALLGITCQFLAPLRWVGMYKILMALWPRSGGTP